MTPFNIAAVSFACPTMASAGPSKKAEPATRSKLVIRRLPPALPEAIFWTAVEQWVNDQTCLWRRYVKGKPGDGWVKALHMDRIAD